MYGALGPDMWAELYRQVQATGTGLYGPLALRRRVFGAGFFFFSFSVTAMAKASVSYQILHVNVHLTSHFKT